MRLGTMVFTLALGSSAFLFSDAVGQDQPTLEQRQTKSLDSLAEVRNRQEQAQKSTDQQTLSDLKDNRSDTKQEAKEAQRAETKASNSAKASKSAYKAEKKAQKARKRADAQAAHARKKAQ